ncbi:MAG: DegT/DnrJ/EryC1/StrS family aminotransferase [Nanobdellota archaeon]
MELNRWPVIGESDYKAVKRVLDSGVLSGNNSAEVTELEKELAERFNHKHVVCTGSGTFSLMLALMSLDLPEDAEIIVPAYTFGATAMAPVLLNKKISFAEVDENYNIDPHKIENVVSHKTKVIVVVHMHGLPADMEQIMDLAQKHNFYVIEDCAQAHGATYKGRFVGNIGIFGCFSLQSSKHLGAGEGGYLTTNSNELAVTAQKFSNFGIGIDGEGLTSDGTCYFRVHEEIGCMFRIQEMTAALARNRVSEYSDYLIRLRENIDMLFEGLKDLSFIILPCVPLDRSHVWHKIRIGVDFERINPHLSFIEQRTNLFEKFRKHSIPVTLWQEPVLPLHPAFRSEGDWSNSFSQKLIEGSFILMDENYPLVAQDKETVLRLIKRFRKAWGEFLVENAKKN